MFQTKISLKNFKSKALFIQKIKFSFNVREKLNTEAIMFIHRLKAYKSSKMYENKVKYIKATKLLKKFITG